METINNLASGAAKLVWGENNTTEADKTTTTTTTEANTADENQKPFADRTVDSTSKDTKMNPETQGQEPISGKLGDTAKEPAQTETQASGLETSKAPTAGSSGVTGATSAPNTATSTTDTFTGSKGGASSELPSTTGDHGGFKGAQADIRDPETSATTDPKVEAQRKNVDDTGALDDSKNPAKADGPGPKPIEEVARERGGDAANIGGKKEGEDDDPEGLHSKSDKKGTGEQYVKTSGLQADGGDFDATKPGAGKEADRLLEEKGIETPAAAAAANKKSTPGEASPSASSDAKKDKPSLKEKIKAKLHKN